LRLVAEVSAIWSDVYETVSSECGFVLRRKSGPELALSGSEIEIVNLHVDAVGVREKYVIGIAVLVDDFLARGDARKFAGRARMAK
jgi:hypothetical protein